jgi:hypothetical protein
MSKHSFIRLPNQNPDRQVEGAVARAREVAAD